MPHLFTSSRFGPLHAHRFFFRAALSLSNVFAWIFVLQYFFLRTGTLSDALVGVALMYGISQLATIVLTPIAAAHLRRGAKHSLVFGALVAAGALIYLGATLEGTISGAPEGWGIAVFAFLMGAYRALYWVPYTLEAASEGHERGQFPKLYEIILALMPLFAGLTLASQPFAPLRLFYGASALMLLSLVPLLFVRDTYENFEWNYWRTFREFFAERHRLLYATALIHGLEGAALFLIWPLAIFLIVGADYQVFGLVMSGSLLAVVFLRTLFRWLARRLGFEHSLVTGPVLLAAGWVARLLVTTPVGVILADSFAHIIAPRRVHALDLAAQEQVADHGSFIDEYTALKEIGLALGRMVTVLVFALLVLTASPVFALAAIIILAALTSLAVVVIERFVRPAAF